MRSKESLFKMSRGIARMRLKKEVDTDDSRSAIEYFERITQHEHDKDGDMSKCEHCRRTVVTGVLFEYESATYELHKDEPGAKRTYQICPDCLEYIGSD